MTYASVDREIRGWMSANSLSLFDRFAENEARFCYVSSQKGECLQISVDPPNNGTVVVHVRDVETANDEELHLEWQVAVTDLRATLDAALCEARTWFKRSSTSEGGA